MSRWKVNWTTLVVLGVVAILMLLILVLPDIDLPDTAFHRGTAPAVLHARATAAPASIVVALAPALPSGLEPVQSWESTPDFSVTQDSNFRPILLRSIRC